MCFLRYFSFILVANVILVTQARREDLFLSDLSDLSDLSEPDEFLSDLPEPLPLDSLVNDVYPSTDPSWSSNDWASDPDLALGTLSQDMTSETDDAGLFIDFSSDLLATDPSNSILISSACNTQGSLTDDYLQARDDGSCSNPDQQQDVNLPNLFDENFFPQGLESSSVEQTDQSSQAGADWAAYGLMIPASLRHKEDPQMCPPDIFLASITPVCNNPVTGRVEYETAKLYASIYNIIPCMYFMICIFRPFSYPVSQLLIIFGRRHPYLPTAGSMVLLNNTG